jgi:hypothetical protein
MPNPPPPPPPNLKVQIPASTVQPGDLIDLGDEVVTATRVNDVYGNPVGMDEQGNRVVYFLTQDGQQVTLSWPLNDPEPMVWKRGQAPTPA